MALPDPIQSEFEPAPQPVAGRRVRTTTLPFARPDISDAEIDEVVRVLRSGWLTSGPEVKKFEEEFARFLGVKHAIALNSATAALHLGLLSYGVDHNDAVLVPSITFTATAEVVTYQNALPLFLDVDRKSYLLTPEILERFIKEECDEREGLLYHKKTGRRIKAMIPVHLAGRPCDMEGLLKLGERYTIHSIEDAAHAFPARIKERSIGTISPLTAFSFYATKNITTGEGGMITTDDPRLAEKLRRMRLHGIEGQTYGRKRWHYDVVEQGFKYNMTDLSATIGRIQLSRTPSFQERREKIFRRYEEGLNDLPGLRLPLRVEGEALHLFIIEITPEAGMGRDRFVEELYARGIATSLHFIPLYRHKYYQEEFGYTTDSFPVSEEIYEKIVSLPVYSAMTDEDVEDVIFAIRETLTLEA